MIIIQLTVEYEKQAREVILEGLEERFGFIDSSFNPDLKSMLTTYSQPGALFLVGILDNDVVCTGALTSEAHNGRIQRMSVKKAYRRLGLAGQMLKVLEQQALQFKYKQLVLETNIDWDSAILFYKQNGYEQYLNDGECVHFFKKL